MTWLLFAAVLLFTGGLRLSAFFSGSETGFYRVSPLQVLLKKQQGDPVASRLYRFVSRPEHFVATTLVGNNVSNYLITLAISVAGGVLWHHESGTAEVLATLSVTPIVFIFGELIPKSLYYRAPMRLLRRGSLMFQTCHLVFLPMTYPLIRLARLVTSYGASDQRSADIVFGRMRLSSVLEAGRHEGILTELQRSLTENLMQVAAQPVEQSMLPSPIVQGLSEQASAESVVKLAERLNEPVVLLHPPQRPLQWSACVRIVDLVCGEVAPRLAMKPLPQFASSTPRLEVLTGLFRTNDVYAAIVENDRVVGVISRQVLVSQLFRASRTSGANLESLFASGNRP